MSCPLADTARPHPCDHLRRAHDRPALIARRLAAAAVLAALTLLPGACKPPPSDAAAVRVPLAGSAAGRAPSAPLASPDTTGALWAETANRLRLVYGRPGEAVLLALECQGPASPAARLVITRMAPADAGAGALLALVGKEAIARIPVDATLIGGRRVWQGAAPALDKGWDALKGLDEASATVPGAGKVQLNPSPLPFALVEQCRGAQPSKLQPQPSPGQ
ncbi:hypothetical protein [Erythrobacter cryptus]|uniref:hypothetical protein n=1 Tax=Erythrobacter cryptus TaxID=196588 RepID=UPI00047FEEA8|nr:hypothetical protein [Erythrobacter cryptus]